MPPKKLNLQERIFKAIKDIGLTNGQKHDLCKALYGKGQVCLLNRTQGLDLEAKLKDCLTMTPEECMKALMPPPPESVDSVPEAALISSK